MSLLAGQNLETIDVDKLGKLLDLQKDWEDREAKRQFHVAVAGFQSEMPPVFKWRQESKGKYFYASYDDIMKVARPILKKYGLSVSFSQADSAELLSVVCRISHIGGHTAETPYSTPKDGPIKTREGVAVTSLAQAQSSSNTYARRICLCNALDIVVTDEDTDGAPEPELITEDQAAEIYNLLEQIGDPSVKTRFLAWLKVDSVEKIRVEDFKPSVKNLTAKLPK